MQTYYRGIEKAAEDFYTFSMICSNGAEWISEELVVDTIFLALENHWMQMQNSGEFSHTEYREECFKKLWEEFLRRSEAHALELNKELPLGHEEMRFYRLPVLLRALLYLRTKKKFSLAELSRIFSLSEAKVEESLEKSREFLLGRSLIRWEEF